MSDDDRRAELLEGLLTVVGEVLFEWRYRGVAPNPETADDILLEMRQLGIEFDS